MDKKKCYAVMAKDTREVWIKVEASSPEEAEKIVAERFDYDSTDKGNFINLLNNPERASNLEFGAWDYDIALKMGEEPIDINTVEEMLYDGGK